MITKAIASLRPNAAWTLNGDHYSGLIWLDKTQTKPTEEEIVIEVARLKAVLIATEYQRSRSAEYPPLTDYLDGIVKGDQAQIDKYIADCQAVKAKYPKGA